MIASRFQKRSPASVALLVLGTLACVGGVTEGTATADATSSTVAEQQAADVSCEMTFSLEGWSAIVSKSEGKGTVTCDNGQTADVVIHVTGGGLTFSKTKIDEGTGKFSRVADISEVFGSYAQAEAQAGAVKSSSAQVMTKGEVSLAVTSEGRGWSIGISGAKFEIKRAES